MFAFVGLDNKQAKYYILFSRKKNKFPLYKAL